MEIQYVADYQLKDLMACIGKKLESHKWTNCLGKIKLNNYDVTANYNLYSKDNEKDLNLEIQNFSIFSRIPKHININLKREEGIISFEKPLLLFSSSRNLEASTNEICLSSLKSLNELMSQFSNPITSFI